MFSFLCTIILPHKKTDICFHVELQYFEKKSTNQEASYQIRCFAALAKMMLLYFYKDVNDQVTRTHL